MEFAAGAPARWVVTLTNGGQVDVWADAVTGLSGPDDGRDYVFGVLVNVAPDQQSAFEVLARNPSDPNRVEVAVARFPRAVVAAVLTADDPE